MSGSTPYAPPHVVKKTRLVSAISVSRRSRGKWIVAGRIPSFESLAAIDVVAKGWFLSGKSGDSIAVTDSFCFE
jgi:hypothetical protein